MQRRTLIRSIPALAAAAWIGGAGAGGYPSKPVRLVVPFPAGGSTDIAARMLAERLRERWEHPVIVENRPGATGMIGAEAVARAPADGHTLLFTINSFASNPAVQSRIPYDTFGDFAPIGLLATNSVAFVVSSSSKAKTVGDLLAELKNATRPTAYASFGQGSLTHVYGELLNRNAGTRMTHVPYKGEAPAIADLIGGTVDVSFASPQTAMQQAAGGKIRILAIADEARNPLMPDVPTFAEAGLPALGRPGWAGVLVRSGTDRAIIDRLVAEVRATANEPGFVDALKARGILVRHEEPEVFARRMRDDLEFMRKSIASTGIRIE